MPTAEKKNPAIFPEIFETFRDILKKSSIYSTILVEPLTMFWWTLARKQHNAPGR
jgi:hypothetical protein